MIANHAQIVLDSPRVHDAMARDSFTSRLASVVDALTESLRDVHDADASQQLAYLSWYLCDRTGGGLCDCGAQTPQHCTRQRCCMLTPIE